MRPKEHSTSVVYRTLKQYTIKGKTQSQIISYTLFDLAESNQFKFIFNMNHGSSIWIFERLVSYVIEQNSTRRLPNWYYCILILSVFRGNKFHNVLYEFRWTYWLNWVKVIRCTLSISQRSFGYNSVHEVYSEFRVWLFDSNTFPKDSIFDTAAAIKRMYENLQTFADTADGPTDIFSTTAGIF